MDTKTFGKYGQCLLIVLLLFHSYECSCNTTKGKNYFGPGCGYMCHCFRNEQCDDVTGSCKSGCAKDWGGPGCQYRKISQIIIARISNTYNRGYASNAIDDRQTTCTDTGPHLSYDPPWWSVTLERKRVITGVTFIPMAGYLNQFQNFKIIIADIPNGRANTKQHNSGGNVCYSHVGDVITDTKFDVICDKPTFGNQVRILLRNRGMRLVLCDVRIYGGRNIAISKGINSSKLGYGNIDDVVDGVFSQRWSYNEGVILSSTEFPQWLEIDLGGTYMVWGYTVSIHDAPNVYFQIRYSQGNRWSTLKLLKNTEDSLSEYLIDPVSITGLRIRRHLIRRNIVEKRLFIREVQIWGDCRPGQYGCGCRQTCDSHHCVRDTVCDKVSGNCPRGCEPGWEGPQCSTECSAGRYGRECRQRCESLHCARDTVCDKVSGNCPSGCEPGWEGPTCITGCSPGRFGRECGQRCGGHHCVRDTVCDKVSGNCPRGCEPGWEGPTCSTECSTGRYGHGCKHSCNDHHCVRDTVCDKVSGNCPRGCEPGWEGPKCSTVCPWGYYGQDCNNTCECPGLNNTCHHVDGQCDDVCSDGSTGSHCVKSDQQTHGTQLSTGSLVAIVLCPALVLVVGVAVTILVIRRKRRDRKERARGSCNADFRVQNEPSQDIDESIELQDAEVANRNDQNLRHPQVPLNHYGANANPVDPGQVMEESVYANITSEADNTTIGIRDLGNYIASTPLDKVYQLFQTLPRGLLYPTETANLPENRPKHRYQEVYTYDHCRVVLQSLPGVAQSDYINAAYINGFDKTNAYIAAAAPIDTSLDDFWRMIWERQIETVVMVTNLEEAGKVKCLKYWPELNEQCSYKELTVTTRSEERFAEFTVRSFTVVHETLWEQRRVNQYHFTAWPDKDVPDGSVGLAHFLQVVRKRDRERKHQWLVHCSAGVGRTGTFIALDILYSQGLQTGHVNVYQCVEELRQCRVNMVQTKEQYRFIHEVLFELLALPSRPISSREYETEYTQTRQVDPKTNTSTMELHFQELEATRNNSIWQDVDTDDPKPKETKLDKYKVVLSKAKGAGSRALSDAIYLPSYRSQMGFVISSTPNRDDVQQFVRLIWRDRIGVIVTLNHIDDKQPGVSMPLLTTNERRQSYQIDVDSVIQNAHYETVVYEIKQGGNTLRTHHMVYKDWPMYDDVPKSNQSLLELLRLVENYRTGYTGPVLVFSSDGIGKGCFFCIALSILERAQIEDEIAVTQIIRHFRSRYPNAISCFEQYECCQDVVQLYLQSNMTYVNT